jgi:hypothetical protein
MFDLIAVVPGSINDYGELSSTSNHNRLFLDPRSNTFLLPPAHRPIGAGTTPTVAPLLAHKVRVIPS